uniref:Uncharacterized protein n=1 Tax=Globodera rostochiensis TaxID=31243 RepID=A0A914HVL6_GLORO
MSAAIGGHGEDDNSKSAEELLRELALLNHNDEAISIDWLAQMLGDARECIRRDGVQQKRQQPISNSEDIKSWADELKQQRHARELPELLAVACRACKLAHGYYPRDAQIHFNSVDAFTLQSWASALRDGVKTLDALARRDADGLKTFYGMFGLTVGHFTEAASVLALQGMLLLEGMPANAFAPEASLPIGTLPLSSKTLSPFTKKRLQQKKKTLLFKRC